MWFTLLMLMWATLSAAQLDTTDVDICRPLMPSSTEYKVLEAVRPCVALGGDTADVAACRAAAQCVADAIVNVTAVFPCETVPDEQQPMVKQCSQATAAFVLVEQLRKLSMASVVGKGECEPRRQLLRLLSPCAPTAIGSGGSERLAGAYDSFIRTVSRLVGNAPAIHRHMRAVSTRKAWQGAAAIAFTFACPGLFAVFSLQHAQLIVWMQMAGMALIFAYVARIHGILFAASAVSICMAIFVAQLYLMAKVHGQTIRDSMDATTAVRQHTDSSDGSVSPLRRRRNLND